MRLRTTIVIGTVLAVGAVGCWLVGSGRLADVVAQEKKSDYATPKPPADFKGTIKLDVRDSTPDWKPFIPKKAPAGAPNILYILYDDTGMAAWSPSAGASTCRRWSGSRRTA